MRSAYSTDPITSQTLYRCKHADCDRLGLGEYCCIWCEYRDRFGTDFHRHALSCERRYFRIQAIVDDCDVIMTV